MKLTLSFDTSEDLPETVAQTLALFGAQHSGGPYLTLGDPDDAEGCIYRYEHGNDGDPVIMGRYVLTREEQ